MRRLALVVALSWFAAGCEAQPLNKGELQAKESALNKLAVALESAVRFRNAPEGLTEDQLKAFAWRELPVQREALKDLMVRVRRQGRDSSVLVCTADGKRALWEDAGCTKEPDLKYWEKPPPAACEFRLDLVKTCQ
jgi:hypothetical protein